MRRQPTLQTENLLRLTADEVERLKADIRRFSDGSGLVVTTPTTGSGPTDGPPTTPGAGVEPLPHVLYGSKHTRSLRVTAGAGLNINFEQGQEWVAGVFYTIAADSLAMTDNTTNYVFVNTSGAVAVNTTGFPSQSTPLAEVVTSGGDITSVADRRSYLAGGVHGAGILLGNPLEVGIDDTDQGTIILYGDGAASAEGGEARFHLAADHDGVFEHWLVEAYEDDFRILRSDGGVVPFTVKADRNIEIGAGCSISLDSGGLILGVDGEAAIVMDGSNWTPVAAMGIGESGGSLYLQGRNDMVFVVDPGAAGARNFYWYHGADLAGGTLLMQLPESGQLRLPISGFSAGLLLGGDVNFYHSAANTLWTNAATFVVGPAAGATPTYRLDRDGVGSWDIEINANNSLDIVSNSLGQVAEFFTNDFAVCRIGQNASDPYHDHLAGFAYALHLDTYIDPDADSATDYYNFELIAKLVGAQDITGSIQNAVSILRHEGTGTLDDGVGFSPEYFGTAAGTTTLYRGVYIKQPTLSGGHAITTFVGIDIDDISQTGVGTVIGIRSSEADVPMQWAGYGYFGGIGAPSNTGGGDVTAARLMVGDDNALTSDRRFQVRYSAPVAPAGGGFIGGSFNLIIAPAAATGDAVGVLTQLLVRPTADSGAIHQAQKFSAEHDDGAFDLTGIGALVGLQGQVLQAVAGTTVAEGTGFRGFVRASDGTITTGRAFDARLGLVGDDGDFGTLVGFDVVDIDVPTGGIGDAIGFRTRNLGAVGVTNAIGVDVAAQAGAAGLNIGIRNAGTFLQTGTARFDTAVDINAQVSLAAELILDAGGVISTISKSRQAAGDQFLDFDFDGLQATEDARIRIFRSSAPAGADDRFTVYVPNTATVAFEVFADSKKVYVGGELGIDGNLNHDGSNIGFFGVAPVARVAAYTPTNVAADRAYDADATTIDELADVLGTLISDLQSYGLLQ